MYTDLFLIVAIVLFGISGFIQGLALQLISFISLLAILIFSTPLARILKERTDVQSFQEAPTFVLWGFSALTIALIAILARVIYVKARKQQGHTPIDRWLGFGVGLLKGLVFAFVVGLILVSTPKEMRTAFAELEMDFKKSKMISGSEALREWDFIPSIAELKNIQKELKQQEALKLEESMTLDEYDY